MPLNHPHPWSTKPWSSASLTRCVAAAGFLVSLAACTDQVPTGTPSPAPTSEASPSSIAAAPGATLGTITAANPSSCAATDGIAFDGTNLLVTCRDKLSIDVVSPVDGSLVRSFTVSGIPTALQTDPGGFGHPLEGFGAATYDADEDVLYVDLAYGERSVCIGATPNCDSQVITVNPATGAFIAGAGAFGLTLRANGHFNLAFDGATGDFWIGTGRALQFYTPPTIAGDGYTLSFTRFNNQAGSPDGIQGVALGGNNFYLSNGTRRQIHQASLRGLSFDAPESEVEARTDLLVSTSFDVTNLTCDNHTFAEDDEGDRDGAVWAQHGFTRTLTAYAIPLGDCVFGGGGPAANLPPVAIEEGDDTIDAEVGEEIEFDGRPSFDREGDTPLTYAWDFDDGEEATGATTRHAFSEPGTYDVTLSVTDARGLTGTTIVEVTVGGVPVNHAPEPTIDGPKTGEVGDELSFTTGATDPDGDSPLACEIDYGDGGGFVALPSCGAGASHSYAAAGSYTVTIRATDPDGAVGTATHTVRVDDEEPPPVACSEGTGVAPTLTLIRAYARTEVGPFPDRIPNVEMLRFGFADPDCGPWRARIDWGDGTVDEFTLDPSTTPPGDNYVAYHDYATPGSYAVKMTLTDAAGLGSGEQAISMTAAASIAAAP